MVTKHLPLVLLLLLMTGFFSPVRGQVIEEAFPNLTFNQPLYITHAPDNSDRLFVLEQPGIIMVFPNNTSVMQADTFLDIRGIVSTGGNEAGLLGLTFHPEYATNGKFYVNYTRDSSTQLQTVIAEYLVDPLDPNKANPLSERQLMVFDQPFSNHNAGMILFGLDGYLYISTGDGGLAGDSLENAQDRTTILGNMLRIDVDTTMGVLQYGIPADNPYAGNMNGWREEIWAYGFRNPYRFSLDSVSGVMWLGDSGQDTLEEIDIIQKGKNYGWDIMEGSACHEPATGCDTTGLTFPVWDYDHSDTSICVVVGGYVYRGSSRADLTGKYIYADYCGGMIWALEMMGGSVVSNTLLIDTTILITSFGIDQSNELYFTGRMSGKVYKFSQVVAVDDEQAFNPLSFRNFPNPFAKETTFEFILNEASAVSLVITDVNGKVVAEIHPGYLSPGKHEILWKSGDLAPGMYFCKLKAGDDFQVRRMLSVD